MSGHGKPRYRFRPMATGSRGPSVPSCTWCGAVGARATRPINGGVLVPLCAGCIERLGSGEHPYMRVALEKRFPAEGGES